MTGSTGHEDTEILRVLLVDDHLLVSEVIIAALGAMERLDVGAVGSVDAAEEAIRSSGRHDVILLDYDVPGMDGLKGLARLLDLNGGGVALFSGTANWHVAERAIKAGARGFLPKTMSVKALGHAIRLIADGELYLPPEMLLEQANSQAEAELKPRELRVLGYLCEGLQNKEIGNELQVDETIVKMDVKSICKKLGTRNRTHAVIEAIRRGIF
ncbi:response regulator [Histidinibacterium lentulum]|nr:response regulator transcription factor [Histidinibacterium lentulum]